MLFEAFYQKLKNVCPFGEAYRLKAVRTNSESVKKSKKIKKKFHSSPFYSLKKTNCMVRTFTCMNPSS